MATIARETPSVHIRENRIGYLDNLRVALIVLVVLHHVAMAYGAGGLAFYYVELPPDGFSRGLLIFVLGNQAWFMGALFLIAGYFTPGSLDRKRSGAFLRDRIARLGIPLLVYAFVFNPLAMFGSFHLPAYLPSMSWDDYRYLDNVRMGPMWFVVLLLVFSVGYVAWRSLSTQNDAAAATGKAPGYLEIGLFVVVLAGVTILARRYVSVGEELWGFPSLAYLPQYASLFALGTVAYRKKWLGALSWRHAVSGLTAVACASVVLFPLAFSGEMFSIDLTESLANAFGGWHWQAVAYALWDSTLVVGLSLGLIVLFRSAFNFRPRFARFLARTSYAVYIVHIPVVVLVAVLMRDIEIEHLVKVVVAASIAVPASFIVGWALRRLPFADKVL